jgi:hypothetical protein
MKMIMPLLAPAAGVVSFRVPEGAALSAGTLIGTLLLDDPLAVVSAQQLWLSATKTLRETNKNYVALQMLMMRIALCAHQQG